MAATPGWPSIAIRRRRGAADRRRPMASDRGTQDLRRQASSVCRTDITELKRRAFELSRQTALLQDDVAEHGRGHRGLRQGSEADRLERVQRGDFCKRRRDVPGGRAVRARRAVSGGTRRFRRHRHRSGSGRADRGLPLGKALDKGTAPQGWPNDRGPPVSRCRTAAPCSCIGTTPSAATTRRV